MKTLKKHLKLIIGIAAIILFGVVFFVASRSSDLENGTLKNWRAASNDRRIAAVKILTASDADTELMVGCINKIATLPDSAEMGVKDAASLCYMGIQLKENI
ncbi:hypothetical protein LJC18_01085 [Lachnospiraceae bacterium OttesenSCG-928-E19]|nr:hypothetical protein [Lachnospiraceae bacterium OttesenSCG-928-E19]